MTLALYNTKSHIVHHPAVSCGHISPWAAMVKISDWNSEIGKQAQEYGRICGTCKILHPEWSKGDS